MTQPSRWIVPWSSRTLRRVRHRDRAPHRVRWWKPAACLGVFALSGGAAVVGTMAGCVSDADLCHPDEGPPAPGLCNDPDAGDGGDASDAAADAPIEPTCAGECVPGPAPGWDLPNLLWIGTEAQAPSCPLSASAHNYDGHADLNAPNLCGACQCDAPTGTCSLPAVVTAYAATCATADSSTPATPFDPPAGWDGGCTTNDSIPAGQLCAGTPCAQSLTIEALTLVETGCAPSQLPVPKDAPASWMTLGRFCQGWPGQACGNSGFVCTPARPPGGGFRLCIYQKGDNDCPNLGPYQEKHVFYDGFEDTRTCSACTCGPVSGSTCSTQVTIFTDDACSTQLVAATVTASASSCHDVPAGSALGSKSATAPAYEAGTCQPSGGEPMGMASPVGPSTFCCIPSP